MVIFNKRITAPILLIALIFLFGACHTRQKQEIPDTRGIVFTTWENICYDRAASIWLIHNFVDSTAEFKFIEFGKKVEEGTPFDVPGAELGRQGNFSCFETIIHKYEINDPAILKMSKLVHDIDVNIWGTKIYAMSDSLDKSFKSKRKTIEDEYKLLDFLEDDFWSLYEQISAGIIKM